MRAFVNDVLRRLVGWSVVALGLVLEWRQRIRRRTYRASQSRLAARYAITDTTPILSFGPAQQANIEAAAAQYRGTVRFAMTSGSTSKPKRIFYPRERLARTRWNFIDAFARDSARMPWRRYSFYVFSSLRPDDSLTSLLLAEPRRPPYLATLQAPYRIHDDPALAELTAVHGDTAVRLWVLALANPGVLYSTNPSSLSTFLDTLHGQWGAAAAMVREFVDRPGQFDRAVHAAARRLVSRGASARLDRIARSDTPLTLADIAPAVHTYVSWAGGYVEPFLRRIAARLPARRYRLLPMYSMSTETPETTPCYRAGGVAFLPLAEGVFYEFLPDGADEDPARLLAPHALEPGRSYTMVTSDAYGLRRYQTDDVFRCAGFVGGLPDLHFQRRRSLSYSFTGEKLTGEQARLALDRLRDEIPALGGDHFMTCVPSVPGDGAVPHYRLVIVRRDGAAVTAPAGAAARFDVILAELNSEYRAKRASGRLGAMHGTVVSLDEFLDRLAGETARRQSWEAQFKFLPLYPRLWDAVDEDAARGI